MKDWKRSWPELNGEWVLGRGGEKEFSQVHGFHADPPEEKWRYQNTEGLTLEEKAFVTFR